MTASKLTPAFNSLTLKGHSANSLVGLDQNNKTTSISLGSKLAVQNGVLDVVASDQTNTSTRTISQTNHGFSPNDWVAYDGLAFVKASVSSELLSSVVWMVTTVVDANTFTIAKDSYISNFNGSGDDYWSNVSLALKFDNSSNQDYVGASTLTLYGSATNSTTNTKFTGHLDTNGSGGSYASVSSSTNAESDLSGLSSWTIDFWRYHSSADTVTSINKDAVYNVSYPQYQIQITNDSVQIELGDPAGTNGYQVRAFSASGLSVTTGVWVYYRFVFYNKMIYIFRAGTLVLSQAFTYNLSTTNSPLEFGRLNANSLLRTIIEDFRITKGVARSIANFTPPASSFSTIQSVVLSPGMYYLSETQPGTMSKTPPSTVGKYIKPVFFADSLSSGLIIDDKSTLIAPPPNSYRVITQAGHGFSKRTFVVFNGSTWVKASVNTALLSSITWMVTSVVSTDVFIIEKDTFVQNISDGGDPNWANTVLLLQFNSLGNNPVSVTNPAGLGTFAFYGDATQANSNTKFTSHLVASGNSGSYAAISTPTNTEFDLVGLLSWTVDLWCYHDNTTNAVIDKDALANVSYQQWRISVSNTGFYMSLGSGNGTSSYQSLSSGTIPSLTNAWVHYRFCRLNNTLYGFRNGTLLINQTITASLTSGGRQLEFGRSNAGQTYQKTIIDQFRIIKNVALSTANFTPPTAPFDHYGSISLSPGLYYLSESQDGLMTTTEPTTVGKYKKVVFCADSSTSGTIVDDLPSLIAASAIIDFSNKAGNLSGGAVNQLPYQSASNTTAFLDLGNGLSLIDAVPDVDSTWSNTTLLLHAEDTIGTSSMTDTSGNCTVGGTGGVISGTVAKFGTRSLKFDRSVSPTLGLYVNENNPVNLSTGDFTIECWIYLNNNAVDQQILNKDGIYGVSYSSYNLSVTSAGKLRLTLGNGGGLSPSVSYDQTGSIIVPVATWTHVAVSKIGTTVYSFVNGFLDTTGIASFMYDGGKKLYIGNDDGSSYPHGYNYKLDGYIDELRIKKNVGLYSAPFTPPTKVFWDPSVSDPYFTSTTLLLGFDGTNNSSTFVDRSSGNKAISLNDLPIISTTDFKTGSSSGYFNGSSNLQIADKSCVDFASNNFTIECWINPSVPTTGGTNLFGNLYQVLFSDDTFGTNQYPGFYLALKNGYLIFGINNGTFFFVDTTALVANTWYHVCLVRIGNSFNCYKNGVLLGSFTYSGLVSPSSRPLGIGADAVNNCKFTGYIDDLRVTIGQARYTATFTPPNYKLPGYVSSGKTLITTPMDSNLGLISQLSSLPIFF
jgi:hypothetical protein